MVRLAIVTFLLLAFATATGLGQGVPGSVGRTPATTIGAALAAAGVGTSGLTASDLSQPVVDVTVEREDAAVLLACYEQAVGGPPTTLLVLVRDGIGGAWRRASVDAAAAGAGAITQVRRSGQFTLVDTRRDDWTDAMLVLDASLQLQRTVQGHLLATLPDGAVLIQENTPEYAPTRPVFVSVFLPGTNTMERTHPVDPASLPRERFVERVKRKYGEMNPTACAAAGHRCNPRVFDGAIVSEVRVNPHGTRIAWVERLGPRDDSQGPVNFRIHVVVSCDRPTPGASARCRERAFGGYDGPDGKLTQEVLDSVIAQRAR